MSDDKVKITVSVARFTLEIICSPDDAYFYADLGVEALETLSLTEGLERCMYHETRAYLCALDNVYMETRLASLAEGVPVRLTANLTPITTVTLDLTYGQVRDVL